MAVKSDSDKIRDCINQMLFVDGLYRDCVLRSGLFLPKLAQSSPMSFLEAGERQPMSPFASSLDISPDLLEIQCSSDPSHPSEGCCNAVSIARHCQASANSTSIECKQMLDDVVWDTYQCPRVHAADVTGAILAFILIGGLFALRYISRSERSQVWVRQLWGLMVKNWRMAKHRWGRQFKGVFIAMVLFGIVIALLHLTGESTDTYEVAIPDTGLKWSFTFTGPDALRATIIENLRVVAGLLFIIAFTYPLAQVVLSIVQEKEFLILEAMKVTGLYDSVLQLSWCLSYLVSFLPLCVLTAIITHFGMIFPNFRISLLIMFFSSFCTAMVSFSLAFTAFFDNTRPAVIFILLATFVSSFLIYLMPDSQAQQGLMCLVAPACLGLGISNALANTSYGSGFRMAYLNYKYQGHTMSMEGMTAIMFLDAIIYAAVGWYLDKILPKKVGIRYPWHFVFHKNFWLGEPTRLIDASENEDIIAAHEGDDDAVLEPITAENIELAKANRCIRIVNLSRKFRTPGMKKRKVALDHLNLTLYEGQITSLLGHNGAGKTTLIRILCGLMQPTSGDANVFGHSIRKDMPTVRRSLGMCPQHDILFEDMTCYENLWLFAALKGVPFRKMKPTIAEALAELGMADKIHEKVENLSGGQKRKLCVAIAFIGRSRVVFLDEPTSGMDPYSRRFTWEVLLKNKKDRVIILTTHFMDEAEVLGDRIAIVNDGRLCCYGTSLFLKQQFGNGYTVSLSVKKDILNPENLLRRIQKMLIAAIPDAKCISSGENEASFQFPPHCTSRFPQLFRQLEAFGDCLEFGVSNCSLEDVFLSVAQQRQDSGTHALTNTDVLPNTLLDVDFDSDEQLIQSDPAVPAAVAAKHDNSIKNREIFGAALYTMVLKRWWLAKRDRRQFFLLVILPIAFLFLPILLPEIEIVQFISKGEHVHPVPGPLTCNPADAFNPLKSCSKPDLSDCLVDGVQVLPQHLYYAWMRTIQRCRRDGRGWDFCRYVPFICNPSVCCDFTDYRSLLYPCQVHTYLDGGNSIHDANIYCPSSLLASIQGAVNAFIKSLAVLLAFLFCPSMIIAHTVMETESHHNTKFQQLVSGVRKITYWAGAAIWDFSTIFVTISAACVTIMYYSGPLKDTDDAYFVVVALFIAYGLAMVPSVYWLSFRFSSAPHALAMLLVFNIATGAGLGIIAYIMKAFAVPIPGSLTLTSFELYSYSRYVLLALPAFNLIDGLLRLQTNTIQVCIQRIDKQECSQAGTMRNGFRLLSLNFLYLGLLLIVSFIAVAFRETQPKAANEESTRSKIRRKVKKHWQTALSLFSGSYHPDYEHEDIDVKRERERIQKPRSFRDPLEIHGLSKTYSNGKTALDELWLGVRAGECFGYLGINGAGKTTTLKCITGFQKPSTGSALIAGYDIVRDVYSARKHSGYCPQFDALFDLLTVDEHLRMYCMIRGISLSAVPAMIDAMQLGMYRYVPSGYLSGGNKRKLSAAIAMIGNPRVIFLDEPSTGMDPHAKRFLWRVVSNIVQTTNAALVLTTHSMEECEALCSRVAILINGRLQCLGSVQHLKSKFGSGYTVEIRSRVPDPEAVSGFARSIGSAEVASENLKKVCEDLGDYLKADKFLLTALGGRLSGKQSVSREEFANWWAHEMVCDAIDSVLRNRWPNVVLKSQHGQHVVFEIPEQNLFLSELFERLESIDRIEYYSVSQTSLEEIFNTFARHKAVKSAVQSPR